MTTSIKNLDKKVRILDNGGETYDRYTAVYLKRFHPRTGTYDMRGMSTDPCHPQGFGQYGECHRDWALNGDDTVIQFADLPEPCQRIVLSDLGVSA